MSDGLNDYVPMHAHDVGGGKAMNEVKEGQQRGWKVCCKDTRVYFDRKILCMVLDCPHGHQELGGLGLATASPSVPSEAEQHRNECEQCNRSMVGENAVCLTCWNHAAALAAPSQREALPAELRELSEKATPGEWELYEDTCRVCREQKTSEWGIMGVGSGSHAMFSGKENAAFAVACVNYVRAALAGKEGTK